MSAARAPEAATNLASICESFKSQMPVPKAAEAATFARELFARLPEEEFSERPQSSWCGMAMNLLRYFKERPAEHSKVRVYNPNLDEHGWESSHTVVEIINDDMPFLVDTVAMAIATEGVLVHLVIHPVLQVQRDPGGHVLAFAPELAGGKPESVMHFEIDRQAEPDVLERLRITIEKSLTDVRSCVRDFKKMRDTMVALADDLPNRTNPHDAATVTETADFLRWVADNHFTFLGYREYETVKEGETEVLKAVHGSGLGILRADESHLPTRSTASLAARDMPPGTVPDLLVLTKTNARSTVHHPGYMDYIGVLRFNAQGIAINEQRFLGLYTSNAYSFHPWDIPTLRRKIDVVIERSGLRRDGHSGKALIHILESLPRDELFQATAEELHAQGMAILNLQERQRTRLFVRRDRFGRFFSCLVFIPRDRFNPEIRERVEQLLKRAFHGERIDSTITMTESVLARLHLVIRPKTGDRIQYDVKELEAKLAQIVRNWHDELRDILVQKYGEDRGLKLANKYGKALPAGYIEEASPWIAASDVENAAGLRDYNDLRMSLYRPRRKGESTLRFKLFKYGNTIALSDALPMLENMGLRVLSEHPYEMKVHGTNIFIQDFDVQPLQNEDLDLDSVRDHFQDAFEQIWRGQSESDGFNRLVLGALLNIQQVSVLRGYAKYLLQTGIPYSQAYMERTVCAHPVIARLLVEFFEAKFDPAREATDKKLIETGRRQLSHALESVLSEEQAKQPVLFANLVQARGEGRKAQAEAAVAALRASFDSVSSLDEDRILRAFYAVIGATLRTSYFQRVGGKPKGYLAFKFDSSKVPDLPKPRPYREIFVYSPRVEGIHLRMGPVARGGLRWSDRREDFRTEVLGLMKAQNVKNTVIVPVGAKGGFVVKLPPAGGDREAVMAEGVACYRLFINGLLDITDNIVDGKIVPPLDVVRHDPDDPYLVVAADKGTATFSDIANAISIEHGFWMGDAFASGGSNGYDHKKMGITAKGGWESVKRHFKALGKDCQNEPFTVVGIGDMSGDVFGNGMLLSRQIRLLAAFDHRHIFLDPSPDPERSFVERERLFALPRSSWADYDASLISAGGGIYARSAKTIPISNEVRVALDLEEGVDQLAPNDLMKAILKAPVELLWNGGIGTYVKAESETHADVGDRGNNALRVNGKELRCKVVGEGGNLGLTQRGRIEFALRGGLLNTDFIDNSAGVDTSDHEVNIKILLNEALARGELTNADRERLLAAMTDEVEQLVLYDNFRQNLALSVMQALTVQRIGAKLHFIRTLEQQGALDRQLEYLPSDEEFAERRARGIGLTRPELSILLSYSKIQVYDQLLDSDVPEDPYLSKELELYFPTPLRERYAPLMQVHRLKREIIATQVTNSMVNRMGATFMLRMEEDTGEKPAQIAKAYTIAREVLRARDWWLEIETAKVRGDAQVDVLLRIWNLMRQMTRWLLNLQGTTLVIADAVNRYGPGIQELMDSLSDVVPLAERQVHSKSAEGLVRAGYRGEFSERISQIPALHSGLDIVQVASERRCSVRRTARVYYALGEALHLHWLQDQIEKLPVDGRWHANARGVLRDELYAQHRALTAQLLDNAGKTADDRIVPDWLASSDGALSYTLNMFNDMRTQITIDYPTVSVAVRRLAQLVAAGVPKAA